MPIPSRAITDTHTEGTIADNAAKMYRSPNVSVGLGIMYR